MKRNDVLIMGLTGMATAAVVLATFWPVTLNAKAAASKNAVRQRIETPKLVSEGCELTLVQTTDAAIHEGKPFVRMTIKNPTAKPVTLSSAVLCQTIPETNPMSRMIPVPKKHWQESYSMTIAPGGVKQINVENDCPDGATFVLISGKKQVRMGGAKPLLFLKQGKNNQIATQKAKIKTQQ